MPLPLEACNPESTTVPSLAEVQTRIRDAVVLGAMADVAPLLVGGRDPAARLAVHRRHYEASLVRGRSSPFPWRGLAGGRGVHASRRHGLRPLVPARGSLHRRICRGLPGLSRAPCRRSSTMPYVRWFARLEWHLGQVALAVDEPPLRHGSARRFRAVPFSPISSLASKAAFASLRRHGPSMT